jgi:hypothetical protein
MVIKMETDIEIRINKGPRHKQLCEKLRDRPIGIYISYNYDETFQKLKTWSNKGPYGSLHGTIYI